MSVQTPLNFLENENAVHTYVQVIIPQALPNSLTYRVMREHIHLAQKGVRVLVQLGNRKIVTGLVVEVHHQAPKEWQAKLVVDFLDEVSIFTQAQWQLLHWMATYYICTEGEVLNAMLPASLKLNSESFITLYADAEEQDLTEAEAELLDIIAKKEPIKTFEIQELLPQVNVNKLLKQLSAKKCIVFSEQVKEKYVPKTVKKVGLTDKYMADSIALTELLNQLNKAPKQQDALLTLLNETLYNPETTHLRYINKKQLSTSFGESSVKALIEKQVFQEIQVEVSRFGLLDSSVVTEQKRIELSPNQQVATTEILNAFQEKEVVLLHGITGSGKTEVYLNLIRKAIEAGTQALFILPEIALTTQILSRIKSVLGNYVALYHSRMSDAERAELYINVLEGKVPLVVGVRSALFLPFQNLSLVVVDEEHEPSYKQNDPAPRYHGRDVAIVMAKLVGAKVLLGSATPSFEAYYQTQIGKWALVELKERYANSQLPTVEVVDLRPFRENKELRGSFSPPLLDLLTVTKENGFQSILFQNRRGYSPYVMCNACGEIPKCINCDVSLTQHLKQHVLRCHYCGYTEPALKACKVCGSVEINSVGFGTERIEDELSLLLPSLKIQRMDLDTTRNKGKLESIIEDVENGETDVLVGTQMVTKGFDFAKMISVGIFDIDRMIHLPDFRAAERCFQVVMQVAGRAGRRQVQGKLLIQTNNPKQPIIHQIEAGNYIEFYHEELKERERFHYPPYTRIIEISVRHEDLMVAKNAAASFGKTLRLNLGSDKVLGPEAPSVGRIRNKFHFQILLKLEPSAINFTKVKLLIKETAKQLIIEKTHKKLQIVLNVDPL